MLTPIQIDFLNDVCLGEWEEEYGIINVKRGNVHIKCFNKKLPVRFGHVRNNFICSNNTLTTLYGCPSYIGGYFECDNNSLTTLEGGPKEVTGYYSCTDNLLKNLIGAPKLCNSLFACSRNQLTTLEGFPLNVKGDVYLDYDNIVWGIGKFKNIEGKFNLQTDIHNINKWILQLAKRGIIFPYYTLEENINWIDTNKLYSILLNAPEVIINYFGKYITYLVHNKIL